LRLADVPPEVILNRVQNADIYSPSGQHVAIGSKNEAPVVLDRVAFDRHFYEVALSEGARFETGQRVKAIKKTPDYVKVVTNAGEYTGNVVVGADGPLSVVARQHGIVHDHIFGVQARVNMPDFPPDKTDLYMHPYWRDFFGWIVPEGNGICRVGLGARDHPNTAFKYLLHRLGISRDQFVETYGGIIPMGFLGPQAFNRAILLGDAACQVKASTGGGIVMLVLAAQLAAPALVQAVENSQYSGSFFYDNYQVPCEVSIGRELKIHYLLRSLIKRFSAHEWDQIIGFLSSTEVRHIFTIYGEMDFPRSFFFKLLRNARIFSLFVKLLSRNFSIFQDIMKIWRA
jgi:flavin-dependent dehydrogenase